MLEIYIKDKETLDGSHLFQRVASFLLSLMRLNLFFSEDWFSSLSESGFIPTTGTLLQQGGTVMGGSHLFQRVASFLQVF